MPSGTGKTVSLVALITSYRVCTGGVGDSDDTQLHNPSLGRLVYCSRTVSEVEKVWSGV